MKTLRTNHLLVLILASSLSCVCMACDQNEVSPPAGPPATVDISGKALAALPPNAPLAGAAVEIEDLGMSTTTDADGLWSLEDVPNGQDYIIKVTGPFPYPPAYNSFPLSLGIVQYDLQVLDRLTFFILALILDSSADQAKACLIVGAAAGFKSVEYPQQLAYIKGVTVTVQPETPYPLKVTYVSEAGLPDPTLTETSAAGAFMLLVPDATEFPYVMLSGTKPGTTLLGSPAQTHPGSFVPSGLIDPFYAP